MIKLVPLSDASANGNSANPQEDYLWFLLVGGATALVLAIGLFVFAFNLDAREQYHGWYVLGFFALTAGFAASLITKNFVPVAFLLLLIVADLGVSWAKFDWHRNLVEKVSLPGQVTVLGDYVTDLPSWEENLLATYTQSSGPDWIRFDEECYRPALTGGVFPPACKTKDGILTTYRLPVMQTIDSRFQMMKTTAKQVVDQQLTTKVAYDSCIATNSCAVIPLLPNAADPTKIQPGSEDYKDVRNAFWQLIDRDKMTIAVCESIPLCKAMTVTGAVDRTDFQDAEATPVAPTAEAAASAAATQ